eukprot:867954-Prymnesium_polylepis.1
MFFICFSLPVFIPSHVCEAQRSHSQSILELDMQPARLVIKKACTTMLPVELVAFHETVQHNTLVKDICRIIIVHHHILELDVFLWANADTTLWALRPRNAWHIVCPLGAQQYACRARREPRGRSLPRSFAPSETVKPT